MNNTTYRVIKLGRKKSRGRWGIERTQDGKATTIVTGLKSRQAQRRVMGLVYGIMDVYGVATKNWKRNKAEAEAEASKQERQDRKSTRKQRGKTND